MNTIVVFHGEFRQISYMEKNAICSFLRSRMIFTVSFESGWLKSWDKQNIQRTRSSGRNVKRTGPSLGSICKKIPPTQRSDDFVGWIGGKMNRVCCGAVDLLGIIHGEAVFKMNTTTSCGWIWTNPQNQWDLQERYHCMWKSSRGFWKIYGSKV